MKCAANAVSHTDRLIYVYQREYLNKKVQSKLVTLVE